MIHVICCQCGIKYNEKNDGKTGITKSHGYCEKCFIHVTRENERKIQEMKNRYSPGYENNGSNIAGDQPTKRM